MMDWLLNFDGSEAKPLDLDMMKKAMEQVDIQGQFTHTPTAYLCGCHGIGGAGWLCAHHRGTKAFIVRGRVWGLLK